MEWCFAHLRAILAFNVDLHRVNIMCRRWCLAEAISTRRCGLSPVSVRCLLVQALADTRVVVIVTAGATIWILGTINESIENIKSNLTRCDFCGHIDRRSLDNNVLRKPEMI